MTTYYMTFGQKSDNRNHWVEIQASNYQIAFDYAKENYADSWSNLYKEDEFSSEHFSGGKLREEAAS